MMITYKPIWKLQDAKAQFSKVIRDALANGPQYITRRGEKAVVILSVEDYEKLRGKKPSLAQYLLNAPKIEDKDFEFERTQDLPREIDL